MTLTLIPRFFECNIGYAHSKEPTHTHTLRIIVPSSMTTQDTDAMDTSPDTSATDVVAAASATKRDVVATDKAAVISSGLYSHEELSRHVKEVIGEGAPTKEELFQNERMSRFVQTFAGNDKRQQDTFLAGRKKEWPTIEQNFTACHKRVYDGRDPSDSMMAGLKIVDLDQKLTGIRNALIRFQHEMKAKDEQLNKLNTQLTSGGSRKSKRSEGHGEREPNHPGKRQAMTEMTKSSHEKIVSRPVEIDNFMKAFEVNENTHIHTSRRRMHQPKY